MDTETSPGISRIADAPIEERQSGEVLQESFSEYGEGPSVGTQIGQYELIRELGRGGMGVVFLARDNKLGRRVAIKFLQITHPELVRRFVVEARATARCTHENIVVIHEVGEFQGSPFMVLEFVEGQPMASLRSQGQIPVTRAVDVMVGVVRALAKAHDEGIVHRDLKPENVILGNTGSIKVLDFGIAKLLESNAAPAAGPPSGTHAMGFLEQAENGPKTGLVGTIAYMSPEQWGMSVDGEVDHRTDVWAVGIMLWELLAGKHPLLELGENLAHFVTRLDEPMPSLGSAAPDLPADLVRVVDTCLRKRRAERYESARELLRVLEPFLPGRFQAGKAQIESGPYTGLRAFQEEDSARFFGRSSEIVEILTRIRDTALVAVVGPSGVGKSSFLRAGVVPALKSEKHPWDVLVIRPGRQPMLALTGLCVPLLRDPHTYEGEHGSAEISVQSRLVMEPGFFGALLRDFCRRTRKGLLLLVDQFEELYTLGAPVVERKAFTAALSGAADDPTSPVRVVATIRADFLGRVAEDARFMNELRNGLFFLGPPSPEGLRAALVRPVESVGYRFESDVMVEEMVHFLESSPNGLPLLQFTAAQLWEHRDPLRRLLTEQRYRELGGVSGALVAHADQVISRLSAAKQILCRNVFVHLVTAERTRAVRNLTELSELVGDNEDLQSLIDDLVDSRLLVVRTLSEGAAVELVHESLILTWPTLGRWLDASHEDSLFLDQLLAAAHQWDVNRRASGLLWGGDMVTELKLFQRRFKGKLPSVAEAFVEGIERQAARRKVVRRGLLAAAIMVTVALLAAAAVALIVISSARAKAVEKERHAVAAQADAQMRLQERIVAEQATVAARAKADAERAQKEAAEGQVKESKEELKAKAEALAKALQFAEQEKKRAEDAQKFAEKNARDAETAKKDAEQARFREEALRKAAEERAKQAEIHLGAIAPNLSR
jgi:serine/threonine protein kinase